MGSYVLVLSGFLFLGSLAWGTPEAAGPSWKKPRATATHEPTNGSGQGTTQGRLTVDFIVGQATRELTSEQLEALFKIFGGKTPGSLEPIIRQATRLTREQFESLLKTVAGKTPRSLESMSLEDMRRIVKEKLDEDKTNGLESHPVTSAAKDSEGGRKVSRGLLESRNLEEIHNVVKERLTQEKLAGAGASPLTSGIADLMGRLRSPIRKETPIRKEIPGSEPRERWGEYTFQLRMDKSVAGNPEEFERGFTLPGSLSVPSVDIYHVLVFPGLVEFRLRNPSDNDLLVGLEIVNAAGTRVGLGIERSKFRDLPIEEPSERSRYKLNACWNQSIPLDLSKVVPVVDAHLDAPFRLSFDHQEFRGPGPLGPREWEFDSYQASGGLGYGSTRVELSFPFSHYVDLLDGINNNTSLAGSLRFHWKFLGPQSNFGAKVFRLYTGQRPDPETVMVFDFNSRNERVYGIRDLRTRYRLSLTRRQDEFALTGRVKNDYEAYSRLSYQGFLNLDMEMGTYSRTVNYRRLTQTGLQGIPALITSEVRHRLDYETKETRPIMSESWTSFSYKGIPGVRARLRLDGTILKDPPTTAVGGEDSPTLYFDRGTGLLADFQWNSDEPVWGVGLKYRIEEQKNSARDLVRTRSQETLIVHCLPHPRVTMTASVQHTGFESDNSLLKDFLSSNTGLSASIQYVFAPYGALFSDVSTNTLSGVYSGNERVMNVGFESTAEEEGDSYKFIVTSSRLGSRTSLMQPHNENLISLAKTSRF